MSNFLEGNIFIKEFGFRIHPKLNISDLLNSKFYSDCLINQQDHFNGYSWYYFKPVTVLDYKLGINLCFKEKSIYSVILYLPEDEKRQSWEYWSEEHELFRKSNHDKILRNVLIREPDIIQDHPFPMIAYNYKWGQILSGYDTKSGSSHIFFRYF